MSKPKTAFYFPISKSNSCHLYFKNDACPNNILQQNLRRSSNSLEQPSQKSDYQMFNKYKPVQQS